MKGDDGEHRERQTTQSLGTTCLPSVMAAINRGDNEGHVLDVLDSLNIGINETVYDDFPPLHLASVHGALSCEKLLLERGAGLEAKDAYWVIPCTLLVSRATLKSSNIC
ncbi:hypothetical protein MLD38_020362 [Melastoma candidum]|uniref:Uncharacterized protein n=1 Tax=Melastoma candidum TaxID=119954 RepID=A0ACB9QC94_9MYRT|nr:hypothetical protein MLD38_020362 [Melastoma candidum]